jgi:large subunit ribosomal protein L24
MNKIKVKDEVILIAGKDKGSIGTVTKIADNKVVVEGLNIAKKHVKPNPNAGVTGGIVDTEMPVAISNVAIYNAKTKKADRVIREPSARRTPCAVRTTTASYTSPFFTLARGAASLILTLITSPIFA